MARQRALSTSSSSSVAARDQELSSMYDYLAKVILLGPSGCGKSCLLHRFVKSEWRILSSQTIGVEFASKIVKVGSGARRKRIKLQLWDTAGTERFRSVSRSYYRGAAGAILVYDIASHASFTALPTFLNDARALASPQLTILLAGNKADLTDGDSDLLYDHNIPPTPSSTASRKSAFFDSNGSINSSKALSLGMQRPATIAPEGREVSLEEASKWASTLDIPVSVEVSALSGENVEELFTRLARMILTKIELGEIDPDDPQSGIQYGDSGYWGTGTDDGGSIRSGINLDEGPRRRSGRARQAGWASNGLQEWEDVFRITGRRRRGNCC